MQRSRVIQKHIRSLSEVEKEFATPINNSNSNSNSNSNNNNNNNNEIIPIVLVPASPNFVQLSTTIPSGPFVFWQQWDRDMGELQPGVIRFWPAWNRVSHVVTRAPVMYDLPIKDCPTADNVMIDIDMKITFRIGPTSKEARTFIYKIGACRFNQLLCVEAEEAIRIHIHSVPFDQVNDIRQDIGLKITSVLNDKCNMYGVEILSVTISNIQLPTDLQSQLERIASIQAKIIQNQKTHELLLKSMEDEAEKELEAIKKSNERKVQEIKAERKRHEIERRLIEEKAKGDSRVKEVEAMTKADVALKKAKGDEVVLKMVARKEAEALLKKTQLQCQTIKNDAEQKAIILVKESEAQLKVVEAQAKALIARAEAEATIADDLEEKRKFELEWARLKVLEKLASKGRRFITGEMGESILNQLVPLFGDENP